LAALRGVDTPKPDARSMNLKRVAVDYAGLSDEIIRQGRARQERKHQDGSDSAHVDHFAAAVIEGCAD
jgi:hypothetical protein